MILWIRKIAHGFLYVFIAVPEEIRRQKERLTSHPHSPPKSIFEYTIIVFFQKMDKKWKKNVPKKSKSYDFGTLLISLRFSSKMMPQMLKLEEILWRSKNEF